MIRAIIVEDEPRSRETLKSLLSRFCPDVMVVAEASGVQKGREAIARHEPDLVFLDIEMPDGSGFRLLDSQAKAPFDVVFTTAFDQFAIKAIRYAALDYLLKPIVSEELQAAVEKVRLNKERKHNMRKFEVLMNNLDAPMVEPKKIVLSTIEKLHVVDVDRILRCESDNYYTHFYFTDGKHLLISKTLKDVEALLEGTSFVRPHKSHLVNTQYIQNFSRDEGGYLTLNNGEKIPVSRRKKEKILELLHRL